MKKVVVRIYGGFGNQLHCYAFGLAIARQNNVELQLDIEAGFVNDSFERDYLLDLLPNLPITLYNAYGNTKLSYFIYKIKIKLMRIISKLLPVKYKLVIEEKKPFGYKKNIHYTKYFFSPYLLGIWASYRYYKDIENELRERLVPNPPTDSSAINMLNIINSCKSCFIHYRSYKEESGVDRPSLANYYNAAIRQMRIKIPDIHFFVFSDDHQEFMKIINLENENFTLVDLPMAIGNKQSLIDFYLMYSCNHAIIGNSTFSWWAAWLADPEDKIVIAPKGLSPWGEDWLPENWIGLESL